MKQLHEFEIKKMLRLAADAREKAYCPYSGFRVGACLKTDSGAYYLGCNIENAAFTPTNCAERTAMFKAVYEGERDFEALAIISDGLNYIAPCGVCRQVLAEFCKPDMPVICADRDGNYVVHELRELIPMAFTKADMED
ncbi:MAG: cytidine deaminase [Clostridia bacterium]|jgi:cytidine deaminase|nr:cytidine deaminase [Clostridia bacterium]